MTAALRIEVLGPLRVLREDQAITVGAHQLQALLAVLAVRANQVCTPEELLDLVWHDNPPGSGLKVVPPYVYRLRQMLPPDVLVRTPDGYVLRLPPGSLDVADFEAADRRAARLRESGDLAGAAAAYDEALGLFRGEPLAGLGGPYLAAQRQRLNERRDKVFGDRVDVELDRGRTTALVAELVPVVAAKPFDERLTGQLMRALSADGRQAEALALYTRTRETLIDQLGVEPGPALREIHQSILRNEAASRARDELPYAGAVFVGRAAEVAVLVQALDSSSTAPPVVAVDGMGGVGKTALAVHTARRLAERYPDGVLYVDLHGHSPGHSPRNTKAALDHLLVGAGVGTTAIPAELEAARSLWRTTVAGRRMLIVLDNAASSGSVLPLLPGSPTCGVLITSRNQLTGLDVREQLHLDLLAANDATALLTQLVGADRATEDVAASNGLIDRCGNLPLALRIAGARLRHRPTWTVAHINDRLDRVGRRLSELTADGLGISTAFALSYEQLPSDQQEFFRLLSLLPGRDLDQYGAAALADLDPLEASDLAEALVDANLLLQRAPGRYVFHDLLRDYATQLTSANDSPETHTAARDRLLEYYLQACFHPFYEQEGMRYFDPGPRPPRAVPQHTTLRHAKAWADAEADNLAAAVEYSATTSNHERTWQLALAVVTYLERRGKIQQQDHVFDLGLAAATALGDRESEARVLHARGRLIRPQRGARPAAEQLRLALGRLPDDGDLLLRARILSALGSALRTLDPYGEALPVLEEATRLARELREDRLLAASLSSIGMLHGNAFNHEAAVVALEESVAAFRRFEPTGLMADTLGGLSIMYLALDRVDDAIATGTAAYELAVELDNMFSLPWALGALGAAYRDSGRDVERAVDLHRQAYAAAQKIGSRLTTWSMQLHVGNSLLAAGDPDSALEWFEPVLEGAMADKDHVYVIAAREGLADHAAATSDPQAAIDHLRQALALAEEYIAPRGPGLRKKLDDLTG
ncbi:AfsR/SARP family transcriptional regulator [Kribbella antibiotica]|uniref:AfsR/SARP family transcriptional regulator n=1 Tax=Kribbella antibiotica TaxID=190195 RepID=UPI001404E461|nr:BTAD domain-containing putative transcriptional regulator [Kribbella antibiotica]